jgi:hypothetical protein
MKEAKSTLSILDLIQNGIKALPQLLSVSGPGKFQIANPVWQYLAGM